MALYNDLVYDDPPGDGGYYEPPTTPPTPGGTGELPKTFTGNPLPEWEWTAISPFGGPTRVDIDFPGAPRFVAPRFVAPTGESVLTEPGYKFGLEQGMQGLENAAAAKGVLRTGGSLKDLAAWAENYAGTKYNDAFNRALQSYGTEFEGAKSEFEPQYGEWLTRANATRDARLAEFQRSFDEWRFIQQILANRDIEDFRLQSGYGTE